MIKIIQKTLLILCIALIVSCQREALPKAEKDYMRHLSYLMQIKNEVAKTSYDGFSKKSFFQPAVFYTKEGTLVINPNSHIIKITDHQDTNKFEGMDVIQLTEKYTDTINFNFQTSFSDSDSTSLFYKENVLFFQSFELTKKLIGVNDLQDWSIMVIHELFHGYQTTIPEFNKYARNLSIPGGPDRYLGKYYKELTWYKESIYQENELLKAIWIDNADLNANLIAYKKLRSSRLNRIKEEYGIDIKEIEDYEYLMEGNARYFESLCKRYIAKNEIPTIGLTKSDKELITNLFEGYEVKKDKALHNLYNSRYYYQIGYNLSMILEKYHPTFIETLYVTDFNFNRWIEKLLKSD